MSIILSFKRFVGKKYRRFKFKIRDIQISFFPKNAFHPIKLSKAEGGKCRQIIENHCDEIVQQIKRFQETNNFYYKKPEIRLEKYQIVSKIGDYLGPVILLDGKYYRCIKKESLEKFQKLWESGIVQVFAQRGYIPEISVSNYYNDEYPIVLEQKTVKMIELEQISLDQSKKAALFIALLQNVCRKLNCILLDPHFYNFTIENGRFIYFDLGSFFMTDNPEQIDDWSLVICGLYRILFSYFPDSVLSHQELGAFRYDAPKEHTLDLHEFSFFRRRALKYHRRHSSKIVNRAFRNIFENLQCQPWDIVFCFMDQEIDHIEPLLNELL